MANPTIEQILKTGYLKPNGDDWYNMVMGTIMGTGICGMIGLLIMERWGIPKYLHWIYFVSVLGFILYRYWKDTRVTVVRTGLTRNENLNILRGVLNQLGWTGQELPNVVLIGDEAYIMKFISARVFYSDNLIAYSFQYSSNSKGGRPAFFLGIRSYLKTKFETRLHFLLKKQHG